MTRRTRPQTKTRLRPRARKPRRGVVRDREYLAWLHAQPCLVREYHAMDFRFSAIEAHHVDRPTNDRRAVPLCQFHHTVSTACSVHNGGGRRKFEAVFGISFEAEIERLNREYEEQRRAA